MQEITMARKTAAYKVHMDIMAAGEVAAEAFSTFCRLLKTMRDDKLWQELEYSSFEAYCENAVGLKQSQAYNYIKAFENFGEQKFQSIGKLGIRKLQLIGTVPEEQRDQFIDENKLKEMTTREVEAAVKEYKANLKAKDEELQRKQESLDQANKDADRHMMRARQAEHELEQKTTSINALKADLQLAKNQLSDAKAKDHQEDIKKLQDAVSWQVDQLEKLQDEKTELEKQLKAQPIEVAATREVEVIPPQTLHQIIFRTMGTLMSAQLISLEDIKVCAGAEFTSKETIIEYLENLQKMVPGYLDIMKGKVQQHNCEDCQSCIWDDLSEEDEAKGLIYCIRTQPKQPWYKDRPCKDFIER